MSPIISSLHGSSVDFGTLNNDGIDALDIIAADLCPVKCSGVSLSPFLLSERKSVAWLEMEMYLLLAYFGRGRKDQVRSPSALT